MDTINSGPAERSVPLWPARQRRPARRLVEFAAHRVASALTARRAYRELAALNVRTLADAGIVRSELTSFAEAARAAGLLAQFPWNRSRVGA